MTITKEIRENPCKITPAFITSLSEPLKAKRTEFENTCNTYSRELEERRANLRKQEKDLKAQLQELTKERDDLAYQVTEATSRGDLDKAAELDSALEQLESMITTAQRKARLADGAHLKGDPKMLDDVRAAMDALHRAHEEHMGCVEEARMICRKQKEYFERLLNNELKYAESNIHYERRRFEKLEDEFLDGPARRAMAKAVQVTELEQNRPSTSVTSYVCAP